MKVDPCVSHYKSSETQTSWQTGTLWT